MPPKSLHDQVGSVLEQVSAALGPWITSLNGWPEEVPTERRRDPYQQLKVLLDGWHRLFRDRLTNTHKTYVHELRDVRNRWAHHDHFNEDDLWRAVDTGQRLMEAIGATETAARLAATKRQLGVEPIQVPAPSIPVPPPSTGAPPVGPETATAGITKGSRSGRLPSEESVDQLAANIVEPARRALDRLVAMAGGPAGTSQVPVANLDALADLFEAWAHLHGEDDGSGVLLFGHTPGLWHALQGVLPIDRPDRWKGLRKAIVEHLESRRGWVRESPPRGSRFLIPS